MLFLRISFFWCACFALFLFVVPVHGQVVLPKNLSGNMLLPALTRVTHPFYFQVSFFDEKEGIQKARIVIYDYVGKSRSLDSDSLVFEGRVKLHPRGFHLQNPTMVYNHNPSNDLPKGGWFSFEKYAAQNDGSWFANWYKEPFPANFSDQIFNTTVLYESEQPKIMPPKPFGSNIGAIHEMFSNPFSYYTGELNHRACTGSRNIFRTEFYLENESEDPGIFKRMGVFRFMLEDVGGSEARSSFITMQVRVSGISGGLLLLESGNNMHLNGRSGYYVGGRYNFTIENPSLKELPIKGFMRGSNGSRGQFTLKADTLPAPIFTEGSLSTLQLLDSLRNQLAIFKGESTQDVAVALENPKVPIAYSIQQALWDSSSAEDFKTMAGEMESLNMLNRRLNDTLHRIEMTGVDSFTVQFYDNAIYDGDSISVFVNDELIVYKKELTLKPIEIGLSKEMGNTIVIKMLAENLGTIPPNTAIMIIRSKDATRSYPMRSDLTTNGCVIIKLE